MVPVYTDSRRFLQFVVDGQVYQFRALCFGLSTALQVFTRVMASVSLILHRMGIRLLRYLNDWLLLASSHQETLQARDTILSLCHRLGIVISPQKSVLEPCQTATYLGMVIVSPSLRAFPSPERVATLLAQIEEFLSSRGQSMVSWRSLLGCLSSLCHLVPSGRLRMRSLQLLLHQQWDFVDESVVLQVSQEIASDFAWWSDANHLLSGVSLVPFQPDVLFWSNASDQGGGANLLDRFVSGQWSPEEVHLSINLRELRAIRLGLHHFAPSLRGSTVGVFVDNTTALAYLRRQGGTFSPALNREAPALLGRVPPDSPCPPVYHGVQEHCRRFPRSPGPDHRVRMDVGSGAGVGSSALLAGDD